MPKIQLPKQRLIDILDGGKSEGLIRTEQVGERRWSSDHVMYFAHEGKTYSATYSQGLTEQQDESPFEYAPAQVECVEVEEREVVVKKFFPVE